MKHIVGFMMILMLTSGPAMAWSPYFSAGGSVSLNGAGGGFAGAAGVHYDLGPFNMRTEFEYANTVFSRDYKYMAQTHSYDLETNLYMANVYADFRIDKLRSGLHFGLTAGVADYRHKYPEYIGLDTDRKTSFLYGATAGVGLYMIGGLVADIGVRYLRTADADGIDNLSPYFNLRYGF